MGNKKNRYKNQTKEKPDLIESLANLSIEEIDKLQKAAPLAFQSKLQAALNSNDANELMKANLYLGEVAKNPSKIQSVFFDPNDLAGNGKGFKDQKGTVPFEILRRMSDIYVVRAIVNTRIEQIQNFLHFSEDDQKEGFTIRRKKGLFKDKENPNEAEDKETIEKIVKFLDQGGWNDKWESIDDFQDFVRKIAFDSLTLDQVAFEIVRNRNWELQKFRAIDASLVRFLDSVDPKQRESFEEYRFKGYLPRYCMVWQDMILKNPITHESILYYPWELGFGIRNKSTNIRKNGYGTSELETLVEVITWLLWGMQYNGNFFCISENSLIETNKGVFSVKSLCDEEYFYVNTGTGLQKAKAYKTKTDDLYQTRLWNGLKIETSKEHLFLTITDKDKDPVWKKQEDLSEGDYCLLGSSVENNKLHLEDFYIDHVYETPIDEYAYSIPFTPKKELIEDVEFWEMMGFALGDGNWSDYRLEIYPHWKKDKFLFERFVSVCERHGINHKVKEINKKVKRADGGYGYPIVALYSHNFMKWLCDIGFNCSTDKRVPLCVFNLPQDLKGAFLRGWFSADGHSQANVNGYKTPSLCCVKEDLRQDALQLLLSMNIACREKDQASSRYGGQYINIYIQDIRAFVEKVGYLQDYKNENLLRIESTKSKWDLVPVELAKQLIAETKAFPCDNTRYHILKGHSRISRGKLIHLFEKSGKEIPGILKYRFIKFESSILIKGSQQLYDIEVFNDKHIFLCNGIAVHNCNGSQPKGFINVRNANISSSTLNEFRQAWSQTMKGVSNSHRVPVINGIDLEWIDLQKGNKEMEFQEWVKFLLIMCCAVYRMDPSELGFQFKDQAQVFGQNGQKERLQHSREKGLKPILVFLENVITKFIVSELHEEYEFVFTGIEVDDEDAQVDLDKKKLEMGAVAMQDIFKKYSGRDFNEEDDIILNQVYQSAKALKEQQEMYGASVVGESTEEGVPAEDEERDPFDKYEKASSSNPILKAALDYCKDNLFK